MISVLYGLRRNTMANAEQDFVIDFYVKNEGRSYLSPRPKSFESKKSKQVHKYGAKMTIYSKPMILGLVQSMIEDYVSYYNFPEMLRDMLAYDEEYIGTDWDSVDALAYAKMRIDDMKTKPRAAPEDIDDAYAEPEWKFDKDGNAALVEKPQEEIGTKPKKGKPLEGEGGWRAGFSYDEIDREDKRRGKDEMDGTDDDDIHKKTL